MDSTFSIDPEFKELCGIPDDNGLLPLDFDIANQPETYSQRDTLEDFLKSFSPEGLLKLSGRGPSITAPVRGREGVSRSRMEPARNAPREAESAEMSVEEFIGDCEKRASAVGKVRLFKRFIAETNEVAIEAYDHNGECISTRFVSANEVDKNSPLAKAASLSISGEMQKTLNEARAWMTSDNVALAEKAIRSLDVSGFLAIIRAAKSGGLGGIK